MGEKMYSSHTCIVSGCENYERKSVVSFFLLPKELERIMNLDKERLKIHSKVCQNHFKPNQFKNTQRARLNNLAIPHQTSSIHPLEKSPGQLLISLIKTGHSSVSTGHSCLTGHSLFQVKNRKEISLKCGFKLPNQENQPVDSSDNFHSTKFARTTRERRPFSQLQPRVLIPPVAHSTSKKKDTVDHSSRSPKFSICLPQLLQDITQSMTDSPQNISDTINPKSNSPLSSRSSLVQPFSDLNQPVSNTSPIQSEILDFNSDSPRGSISLVSQQVRDSNQSVDLNSNMDNDNLDFINSLAVTSTPIRFHSERRKIRSIQQENRRLRRKLEETTNKFDVDKVREGFGDNLSMFEIMKSQWIRYIHLQRITGTQTWRG